MKYCQYCGAQLNGDAVFCEKCGKRIAVEDIQKSAPHDEFFDQPQTAGNASFDAPPPAPQFDYAKNYYASQSASFAYSGTVKAVTKILIVLQFIAVALAALMFFLIPTIGGELLDEIAFSSVGAGGYVEFAADTLFYVMGAIMLCVYAYVLPMGIVIWRNLNRNRRMSLAFKVCTILFFNFIVGLLLLCGQDL